jgi:hypothetical protein
MLGSVPPMSYRISTSAGSRTHRSRLRASLAFTMVCLAVAPVLPAAAAPVFTDGFESGTTSAWSGATRFSVQSQVVHSGTQAGRASSTGLPSHASRTFTGLAEVWAGVSFRVESRSTAVWLLSLRRTGGGTVLLLGFNSQGRLIARNVVQSRTYTSTTPVATGAWRDLQVHVRTGSSSRFDVLLDGAPVANLAHNTGLGSKPLSKLVIGDTASNRQFVVAFDDAWIDPQSPVPAPPPEEAGAWGPIFDIGIPAVHASVLHTGKVLVFHRTSGTIGTVARLWDPVTGAVENVDATGGDAYNYFCSAHTVLGDGRVFITGGTTAQGNYYGERRTAFFDPDTETWSRGPLMANGRWYPSGATLPDADVLVFSGSSDPATNVEQVERYDVETNTFSTLGDTADITSEFLYPRLFVLPDGTVARVGMEQQTMTLDPGTETWSNGPSLGFGDRENGSMIRLPGNRVLAIGGSDGGLPTTSTEIIDFDDPTPAWRPSGSMAEPRQHLNAVLLPDGTVLAVGGARAADFYNDPAYVSELYDPDSETWATMDSTFAPRAYHSTAVLLPDGRVLSAGQTRGNLQTTGEVFSPPYLFAGPRPVIDAAPSAIGYGDSFVVDTADAEAIDEVTLIRASTVTHGVNFDQRSLPLSFSAGVDSLTVGEPASNLDAPPGWYMLFLLDGGVPSVAAWIQVT